MTDNPEERQQYKVEAERTVFTYVRLMQASSHALEDGNAREEGSFYEWMTAGVFAAFSLEAYLNHLGPRRFQCWDELERLSVEAKLSLILEDLKQQPDFSRRPFQTVRDVLRFRNQLALGRTQLVKETSIQKLLPRERPRYPELPWESQCTKEAAQRFASDVCAVISQLHTWAGLDGLSLFSPETGSRTVAPIEQARPQGESGRKRSARK